MEFVTNILGIMMKLDKYIYEQYTTDTIKSSIANKKEFIADYFSRNIQYFKHSDDESKVQVSEGYEEEM